MIWKRGDWVMLAACLLVTVFLLVEALREAPRTGPMALALIVYVWTSLRVVRRRWQEDDRWN